MQAASCGRITLLICLTSIFVEWLFVNHTLIAGIEPEPTRGITHLFVAAARGTRIAGVPECPRGVAKMCRIALSTALSLLLAASAVAETPREIVVTGEGRIEVAPDMATVSAGVESSGDTAAEALEANAAAMRGVLEALGAAGVAPIDMQTSHIALEPVYRPRSDGEWTPDVVAYRARNTLTIRVREIGAVGRVIDDMMEAGLNRIEGIAFGLDDRQGSLDEARSEAVRDARAKAELYAEAAGVGLGQVVGIRETQPFDRPFPMAMRAEAAMDGAVAEGSVAITAMVEIVYNIEDMDEEDDEQ
jgi:uncharacterized protein YggE